MKTNKIMGFIILVIISLSLFISGIVIKTNEIEGDLGIWLSIISTPLLSQAISIPFKAFFLVESKKVARSIKHAKIDDDSREKIKEILSSSDLNETKLDKIKRSL